MLLVSYSTGNGPLRPGVMRDGALVDAAGLGFGPSAKEILAAGKLDALLAAADGAFGGAKALDAASVRLGPPIPDPDKIICLGLNYKDHAAEAEMALPAAPILFPKYRNSLIGPFDDIVVPKAAAAKLDYEVELAVVIGRRAARVTEANALSYVAGYAVFNDVSARDLQMQTTQWAAGKAIDNFAPMGPGIVSAREIGDPQTLQVTTRVNGEQRQHENTKEMIFSVAQTIAFITSFTTLEPGDIIATGTPKGIGAAMKPPKYMQAGDIVEVEVERIGTLRNRVVLE